MIRERPRRRRLRKQPKVRRMQTAPAMTMPRMRVPETAQRRRKRNRRRVHFPTAAVKRVIISARWLSLLLCALSIAALVITGLYEDYYVTYIPVEGVTSIPADEIVEASGLAGAHVFAVDPNAAAAQVAELPGVISATVSLTWPNQVYITIREETPVALWEQDGQQYWISQAGNVLPARIPLEGMVVIEVEETAQQTAGSNQGSQPASAVPPFIPPEVLAGALQLHELRPNLDRFYYDPSHGLSFIDGQGWRAYFGSGEDMERKMIVYEAIVNELQARGEVAQYISVSNQEKPYYRVQTPGGDG